MKNYINNIKPIQIYFVLVLFMVSSCKSEKKDIPYPYTEGTARIAKWKDDKKAVVTLEFDDSTPGQATLGVPALNARKMVGTWYVNPGRDEYISNINIWENIAPAGGQELANHTMTHTGATTMDQVVYEVGEASKRIWQIRGQAIYGSLIAFNRGGGTTWNEADLAKVLSDYDNIDRQAYIGVPVSALTVVAGSDANAMYVYIPNAIADSTIARIHFHGISAINANPPMDSGNAAVWINEFNAFLDKLDNIKSEIWIAGFIQLYKYIKEQQTATLTIAQFSEELFKITLQSSMDTKYYDEPLTIVAYLPVSWTNCLVSYDGTEKTIPVNNGVAMFDARPNKGDISLLKK